MPIAEVPARLAAPGVARSLRGMSIGIAVAALTVLGACAEVPTNPDERAEFEQVNDPLEPMNRKVFAFNNYLDDNVMVPVAKAYKNVLPGPVQRGIHNFLQNLNEPYIAGNEILQGRLGKAFTDVARFVINSTFGIGGLWDLVADTGGPRANNSDVGVTLGVWGVPAGPFLMLPFVGPSNPRDTVGLAADWWADPVDAGIEYPGGYLWAVYVRYGMATIDTRVQLLEPVADLKRSSLDYYAAVRSLYRQKRRAAIGGESEPVPGQP